MKKDWRVLSISRKNGVLGGLMSLWKLANIELESDVKVGILGVCAEGVAGSSEFRNRQKTMIPKRLIFLQKCRILTAALQQIVDITIACQLP
jgi:hypothetical protein